jgi:hypothetical protein
MSLSDTFENSLNELQMPPVGRIRALKATPTNQYNEEELHDEQTIQDFRTGSVDGCGQPGRIRCAG